MNKDVYSKSRRKCADFIGRNCVDIAGMHGAPEAENYSGAAMRPPVKSTTRSADDDRSMPTCVGCDRRISDQFLLRVAPDLEWHAACLKCVDCGQSLDETCTCFVRDGKTYCRRDYTRSDSIYSIAVGYIDKVIISKVTII